VAAAWGVNNQGRVPASSARKLNDHFGNGRHEEGAVNARSGVEPDAWKSE